MNVILPESFNDRKAEITIGGKEYEMLLTTRATKRIAAKYGGLEKLGDELLKADNFETAIDEFIWLIVLLVNEAIAVKQYYGDDTVQLIDEELVELLTTPYELATYKDKIFIALSKGVERNIQSVETTKKQEGE